MTSDRIYQLASYLPPDSDFFSSVGLDDVQNEVSRFVVCYKDLRFGFHFIKWLKNNKKPLPIFVTEQYLKDAWEFEKTGKGKQHIIEAYSFSHPGCRFHADLIESMLLVDNITIPTIAEKTGYSEKTIEAYEQLFFNILDRKKEAAFIASVVYPETRIVETYDNYIKNESLGNLLKRAGYNNGIDDVMYFAGLRTGHMKGENATEMAIKLESTLMANGYYLARNGFVNQRNATGVNSAKSLIVATKQSGQGLEAGDTEGFGSLGGQVIDLFQDFFAPKVKEQIKLRERIGKNIDEINKQAE